MTLLPTETDQDVCNQVVGMTLESAESYAKLRDMQVRVYRRDGHYLICTRDYRRTRINVALADNVVVDANIG